MYTASRKLIALKAVPEEIRREEFNGTEYLVVPVIALVEGVIHPSNAPSPELALADEFAKQPQGWDGRPVLIDHPERNGQQVSANSTEIWETEVIGQMFNTKLDGNKLKTEAWINIARANELELDDEITRLESGETIEISTGIFVDLEPLSGRFNGEAFDGVWREVLPDHLAILSEGKIGACSVEDGCGAPRANQGCGPGCKCKLKTNDTTGETNEHTHEFNPIEDRTTVANDHDHALVKNEAGEVTGTEESEDHTHSAGVIDNSSHKKKKKKKRVSNVLKAALARMLGLTDSELSDSDRRHAVTAALTAKGEDFFFVVAMFSDRVVFERGFTGELLERSFAIEEDGSVSIGDETVHVRPETSFVPVRTNEEIRMDKKKKVDALIANEATKFTETDSEWLMTLEEGQLDLLDPPAVEAAPEATATPEATPKTDEVKDEAPAATPITEPATNEAPKTAQEYIEEAPEEIQSVLSEGLRLQTSRKDALVAGLIINDRCNFSEPQLRAMQLPLLENLAVLSGRDDFSGQGSPIVLESGDAIPAAPLVFAAKRASAS